MHVQPIVNSLRAALLSSTGIAADPTVEAAAAQLIESLLPALRVAALELAEQAATEVRAQLPEHTVDVILSEGDPTLRINDTSPSGTTARPADEDFAARITLRLPPSLKNLIEDAAGTSGESVNSWVIEALGKRARNARRVDKTYRDTFDL